MMSSNLIKGIIVGIAGTLFASAAWASDAHVAPMTDFAKSTVKQWISNNTVIQAVAPTILVFAAEQAPATVASSPA
jgi:hypothetical protein